MYRIFIPKPKKPGEFRPITEPAKRDRVVLDAMTSLLSEVMEPIFLDVGTFEQVISKACFLQYLWLTFNKFDSVLAGNKEL